VIPSFPRDLNEICALLRFYAAYNVNSKPTFRVNLSVPFSRINVGMELPFYAVKSYKSADLTSKWIKEINPAWIQVRFLAGKTATQAVFLQDSTLFLCYRHSPVGHYSSATVWYSWPGSTTPHNLPSCDIPDQAAQLHITLFFMSTQTCSLKREKQSFVYFSFQ
jgi:hypothetical protein